MSRLSLLILAALLSATLPAYYSPGMGRWTSRDPLGETDTPNLYSFCANDPLNFVDPLGLKRWILIYYSADAHEAFRRAAETMKREIESRKSFNPKCDAVLMKGVSSVDEFNAAWSEANRETSGNAPENKVEAVHLFTHSGPGEIYLRGGSLQSAAIGGLSRLNWGDSGRVVSHGCNSGVCDRHGNSVAGSFSRGQNVISEGQSGYSQFSGRADRRTIFSRIGSGSASVYLWSYGDGGSGWTFGEARPSIIYHPK